jgi:hypothetical protein
MTISTISDEKHEALEVWEAELRRIAEPVI